MLAELGFYVIKIIKDLLNIVIPPNCQHFGVIYKGLLIAYAV